MKVFLSHASEDEQVATEICLALRVGTRSIAYREVNGPEDELGALDPVVVPPLWSATKRSVITIPKLDRFGAMREQRE